MTNVLKLLVAVAALLCSPAMAGCPGDGLSLELGVGAHDPSKDGPEFTTPNALGIADLRYTRGPFIVSLAHTSSLRGFPRVFDSPGEDGYGANVASIRYRIDLNLFK